jgi:hypothetical protein
MAVVPDELRDDATLLQTTIEEVADSGDYEAFDAPDVDAANDRLHQFELANCGWNVLEITAQDFSFGGLPDEVPTGPTSFEVENHGEDAHELVLIKRAEGVTEPVEELLELPDDEVMDKVSFLGVAEPVPGGEGTYLVADLEPGEYVAICFIPTGTRSLDGPPPEGPPHFAQGMVAEFTVS